MKNLLSIALLSIFLTACGGAATKTAVEYSSNAASAASATDAAAANNKRNPKTVCAFLPGFKVGNLEKWGNYDACLNIKEDVLPSGYRRHITYGAFGDRQNTEYVSLNSIINIKKSDAAREDELLIENSDALWQKVFAAPLPNDIKQALLVDKGKSVSTDKKFTQPTEARVTRESYGADSYNLTFRFTLPK